MSLPFLIPIINVCSLPLGKMMSFSVLQSLEDNDLSL